MSSHLVDYKLFLREFRRTFQSTGAVMPSGKRLSNALAHYVRAGSESNEPRRILEVGPGTGAVTTAIASAMGSQDSLHMVELNDDFVQRLRERMKEDPAFQSISDRLELTHGDLCEFPSEPKYDVIISGLPLNNFPTSLVQKLLDALCGLLAPGGTLSFFEYIAIRKAKASLSRKEERTRLTEIGKLLDDLLQKHEIRRDRVLPNIPPAWVHHVQLSPSA